MRKLLLAIVVTASAIAGVTASASAQSVYFGFGDSPRYESNHYRGGGYRYGYRHHYRGDGYRHRYRAYAGEHCRVRVVRRYNEYRGVWVTKRIRTCY